MEIYHDFDLSKMLWYKIGGKTNYLLVCRSSEDIIQALDFVEKKHLTKIFVCGLGSNLIFSDEYFDGAVIQLAQRLNGPKAQLTKNSLVKVFAGELLDDVIQFSFVHNLLGIEWAGGLPGTVGAGIRGNVGAFGGEIKDVVDLVDILDYANPKKPVMTTLTNAQLQFVYRGSFAKTEKKKIVVSANFRLREGSQQEVLQAKQVYEHNKQYRKDHHPLEYPNCGSVFKNLRDQKQISKVLTVYPDLERSVQNRWYGKIATASLIERMGFKGYRIGDAQVSEKHALFIINLGNAKAKEVLQIIQDIQEKFQEKFGFELETEVEIVKRE